MVAIIDSRELESEKKILTVATKQFIAGRASIMAALTASCLVAAAARANDLAGGEKRSGGTTSSAPDDSDAFPRPALDATVLQSFAALTNEFKDQEFGAAKDTATLTLAYAFGKTARRDWTAQVDLPVVHYDAGHITGVESGTGIGDIEVPDRACDSQ